MFKEQITNQLKTEHKSFGLSNEAIDRIASVIEKTVTKEDEIDSVIKSADTITLIAGELQKMRDREIRSRADLQKSFDAYKGEHLEKQENSSEDPKKDDYIKRIEALEKANKEMVEAAKKSARLSEIRSKLKDAGLENENILELVIEKVEIKDEEGMDDLVERLKADYNSKYTKFYGESPIPRTHSNIPPKYSGTEDDDFVEILRKEGKLPQE